MSQEEIKDEFDNKFKKNIMNALDGQDAADISIDIDQIFLSSSNYDEVNSYQMPANLLQVVCLC